MAAHKDKYKMLDAAGQELTSKERRIGWYEAEREAQEEERECAAVRLARRVVSPERHGPDPDRQH
jgi:hypothetical protein